METFILFLFIRKEFATIKMCHVRACGIFVVHLQIYVLFGMDWFCWMIVTGPCLLDCGIKHVVDKKIVIQQINKYSFFSSFYLAI